MTSAAPPPPTDEDLARSLDVDSLYSRYSKFLLAFLAGRGVPRADLEDAHQDVWTSVQARLLERPFEGHFRGFLFAVARNLVITRWRKNAKPTEPLSDDSTPAADPSPLEALMKREEISTLKTWLDQLPPSEAEVVKARLRGEDYPTICAGLRLQPAQAHKLFFQAKQRLLTRLGEAGT